MSVKRLGRGLDALIRSDEVKIKDEFGLQKKGIGIISKIKLNLIKPNPDQPRKYFDEVALDELTASISEKGLISPLTVREIKGGYELIAGERRWQAAQSAGLHEVPVIIIEADNLRSLELAIIENVQRKDLNIIEEAESYQNLIDNFNYDQDMVSKFIGKSRPHISNTLRLLKLPEKLIDMIRNDKISQGHAKILVGLENALLIAEKIVKNKLSVRQVENLVKVLKNGTIKKYKAKDPNILKIQSELTDKIGMNVVLNNRKNNSGSVIFEYKGLDQLDRLIDVIKKNY